MKDHVGSRGGAGAEAKRPDAMPAPPERTFRERLEDKLGDREGDKLNGSPGAAPGEGARVKEEGRAWEERARADPPRDGLFA